MAATVVSPAACDPLSLALKAEPTVNGEQCGTSKKRRLGEISPVELDPLDRIFNVRPHPSANPKRTWSLRPRVVIHRHNLPLASIIALPAIGDPKRCPIYTSHVRLLEKRNPEWGTKAGPVIVIAQDVETQVLYAFERVESGSYAVCRIGPWMSLASFEEAALWRSVATPTSTSCADRPGAANGSQELSSVALSHEELAGKRRRTEASMLMDKLMGQPPHFKESTARARGAQEPFRVPEASGTTASSLSTPAAEELASNPFRESELCFNPSPVAANDPEEVHHYLVQQYMSALYLAQTSLIFFAKSALSRVRAMSQGREAALIQALYDMLLSNRGVDRKFQKTIPGLLSAQGAMRGDAVSGRSTPAKEASKKASKSKRKPKVGRNGMYKEEADFLEEWRRRLVKNTVETDQKLSVVLVAATKDLKIREHQLQALLCLEILGLQRNAQPLPPLAGPIENPTAAKSRRMQDPLKMLEMLFDRISIWQSLANSLTSDVANDSQEDRSDKITLAEAEQQKPADLLRDFYHEIIQPLYGPRVPETCLHIRRRLLGDADEAQPEKPQLIRSRSDNSERVVPAKARAQDKRLHNRSMLQRVLSDEKSASAHNTSDTFKVPKLTRSTTDGSISGSRRCSISSVSLPGSTSQPLRPPSRAGNALPSKLSKREIDLCSQTSSIPSLKRSASVQGELNQAIGILRKPNRSQAVKDLVEESEKRVRLSAPLKRRSTVPQTRPEPRRVQITATPSKPRPAAHPRAQISAGCVSPDVVKSTPTRRPLVVAAGAGNQMRIVQTPGKTHHSSGLARQDVVRETPVKRVGHMIAACDELTSASRGKIGSCTIVSDQREIRAQSPAQSIYSKLGWDLDDDLI